MELLTDEVDALTRVRRILVPAGEVPMWQAAGYVEIYRGPGGWRVLGIAVVMEWRAPKAQMEGSL